MTVITSQASTGAGKIGYENLFTAVGVTVSASTEDTANDFHKENAYDWLGYDSWKPTATGESWLRASFVRAQAVNYMAVWGHNLSDHGSSVKPQYSINGGSSWVDAESYILPSDNSTILFSFDEILGADWRCVVNNPTTIASISGVMIGKVMDLPHNMEIGFAPPSLAPVIKLKTSKTESGVSLGGSVLSEGIEGGFTLTYLEPDWVRSYWQPFISHAQTSKPFVFSWDSVTHSQEVVLGWITEKITPASYSDSLYMTAMIRFEGVL